MRNIFGLSIATCLVIPAAFYGWVLVAGAFVMRDPPVFVTRKASVIGGDFKPGGWVEIGLRVDRKEQCPGDVMRMFTDAQGIAYRLAEDGGGKILPLGERDLRLKAPIPAGAAKGDGRYQMTINFRCWPGQSLHPVTVKMIDVPVTVTE